jgi:hypothetical protein
MNTSFRFVALPSGKFAPPFAESDAALQARGVRRMIVDEKPGFPCRVSLADAEGVTPCCCCRSRTATSALRIAPPGRSSFAAA